MGPLFVIATPIGNLEDITFRAIRVLGEVDLIAAEDTRVTTKLLKKYRIKTRITSYHEHNKKTQIPKLLDVLDKGDLALVSDAGSPVINDPGADLVSNVYDLGFKVVPIPGPSSLTSSLSIAGLEVDQFCYLGYLPRSNKARRIALSRFIWEWRLLVILATPHRLKSDFEDILGVLGDRDIVVCRELTKIHEEIFRGKVSAAINHFKIPKGEFTIVISGNKNLEDENFDVEIVAKNMLTRFLNEGVSAKDAINEVSIATGLSKRPLYRIWLSIKS